MIEVYFKLLFFIYLSKSCTVWSMSVTGYCGDPGLPEGSKRNPEYSLHKEYEIITYTCDDHVSLKQSKQCLKGKWRGEHPICGMTQIDYMVIFFIVISMFFIV